MGGIKNQQTYPFCLSFKVDLKTCNLADVVPLYNEVFIVHHLLR